MRRKADDELFEALVRGDLCYILDTRQVGKSSLMVRTAARLRSAGVRVAALDLSAMGRNVNPLQWAFGLVYSLASQVGMEIECEDFWDAHDSLAPLVRAMATITDVVLPAGDAPLVLFIDEIDAVRSLSFSSDGFFSAIRALFNARADKPMLRKLTFCLIGVATPADLIEDNRTTPFNVGHRIELSDFTEDEAAPLAPGLGEGPVGKRVLRRILHWTSGHPYLTQQICSAVSAKRAAGQPVDVDDLVRRTFLTREGMEIDDNLGFVRDRLLSSPDQAEVTSALMLYRRVLKSGSVRWDATDRSAARLRLAGIVRVYHGDMRLRCRIYRSVFGPKWVESHLPGDQMRQLRKAVWAGTMRASVAWGTLVLLAALAYNQAYRAGGLELTVKTWREKAEAARRTVAELAASTEDLRHEQRDLLAWGNEVKHRIDVEQKSSARQAAAVRQRLAAATSDAERLTGSVASGLAQEPGRQREALTYGLRSVAKLPANATEGVQGLADAVNQGLIRRWSVRLAAPANAAAYSPDGKVIAVCWDDPTVRFLDAANGSVVGELPTGRGVHMIQYSPDGQWMLTYGQVGSLQLWRVQSSIPPRYRRERIWEIGPVPFGEATFTPDSKAIVCAAAGGKPRIVPIDGSPSVESDRGHQGGIFDIACSSRDPIIATAGEDGLVNVWDVHTGKYLGGHSYHGPSQQPASDQRRRYPTHVEFLGGRLISTGVDGEVIASTWPGLALDRVYRHHRDAIHAVGAACGGWMLITGGAERTVAFWNGAHAGTPLATVRTPTSWPVAVAGSPVSNDACLVDASGNIDVWSLDQLGRFAVTEDISCVEYSHDGKRIAFCGDSPKGHVMDLATGRRRMTLETRSAPSLLHITFSPNDRYIAQAAGSNIEIWQVDRRDPVMLRDWTAHKLRIYALDWSPDGKRLLSAGEDPVVRMWDPATGKVLREWRFGAGFRSVRFSRDGKKIAAACRDGAVYVFPVVGGGEPRELLPVGRTASARNFVFPWQASFSPDGQYILSADRDSRAYIFSLATGRAVATLDIDVGSVICAYFSPDGAKMVTAGTDGLARVWRTADALQASAQGKTPSPYLILRGNHEPILATAWCPCGDDLMTGGRDGICREYPVMAGGYVAIAKRMLGRVVAPVGAAGPPSSDIQSRALRVGAR